MAAALEAEPTFAGRLERLAAELAPCGIEALDGEGQPIVAGEPPRDGLTLPLSAGGRGFGSLVLPADTDRALATAVVARAAAALDAARLLESEQRARLRTEVLQGVTCALSGAATPEEVGHAVAEQGARALGGTGGVVYALAPGEQTLRVIGSWGYDPDAVDAYRAVAMTAELPVADVTRDRQTICIQTQTELQERYPMLVDRVVGSLCAVPLLAGEEVLGAVGVSRSDSRGFYPAERELLEALGRQGGQALERARLYRRQQLANDRLHRLQETTAALARALTPQEVAATAAAQGRDALGADSAWVALLDEHRRALELAHAAGHRGRHGAALPVAAAGRRAPAGRGRAHDDAAVAGERGGDLRPVPALSRGAPAGPVGGAAPARRRRRRAGRDRARVRPPADVPAARPRLPADADAPVRPGAGAGAGLPDRARPGLHAPAGAAAGVAAARGRARDRGPLPAGRGRRGGRRLL